MDTLRTGCPWDARQTHETLTPYLLEETYEAVDALDSGDPAAFREELGDVLLQVVFHARVAPERTDGTGYTIDDVADGIIEKLTRRHPHVFGDVTVSGADEVKQNWDAIKAAERQAAQRRGGVGAGRGAAGPACFVAGHGAAAPGRAGRGAPAELADLTSRCQRTVTRPLDGRALSGRGERDRRRAVRAGGPGQGGRPGPRA